MNESSTMRKKIDQPGIWTLRDVRVSMRQACAALNAYDAYYDVGNMLRGLIAYASSSRNRTKRGAPRFLRTTPPPTTGRELDHSQALARPTWAASLVGSSARSIAHHHPPTHNHHHFFSEQQKQKQTKRHDTHARCAWSYARRPRQRGPMWCRRSSSSRSRRRCSSRWGEGEGAFRSSRATAPLRTAVRSPI